MRHAGSTSNLKVKTGGDSRDGLLNKAGPAEAKNASRIGDHHFIHSLFGRAP